MRFSYSHNDVINYLKKLIALMLLSVSLDVLAASTPPVEDIHYLAEHLAEGAQDARYFAMPWPVGDYEDEGWKPLVSIADAGVSQGFADAHGGLFTVGLSRVFNERWALEIVAYYDRLNVSGSHTDNSLSAFSLNGVPLDLPETAIFTNPRGTIKHTGVGFIISHALDYGDVWRWDLLGGLLVEQLKLIDYQFDYELTGGANAGVTGVLDHSGSNNLNYYFLGLQARKDLGESYAIIPRIVLGLPFKKGDFTTRLTGPGFDLSTASTGAGPHQIGDGFAYMGMTVRNSYNHFELDLGALLGYSAFELLAHEGISSALVFSLTWRM